MVSYGEFEVSSLHDLLHSRRVLILGPETPSLRPECKIFAAFSYIVAYKIRIPSIDGSTVWFLELALHPTSIHLELLLTIDKHPSVHTQTHNLKRVLW